MLQRDSTVQRVAEATMRHSEPVRVIAVSGGKGGVGKTTVSVNLASALALAGRQVMLLDGDLGLANVDVLMGISPRYTLAHVLSGERTLQEVIVQAPNGIRIAPGASGVARMANLSPAEHIGLVRAFSGLGSEIDTDLPFDRKIELSEQYKVLSESDFDEAEANLGPLVSAMYSKAG